MRVSSSGSGLRPDEMYPSFVFLEDQTCPLILVPALSLLSAPLGFHIYQYIYILTYLLLGTAKVLGEDGCFRQRCFRESDEPVVTR